MDIVDATRRYEAWLGRWTTLVKPDLKRRHALMHDSLFHFLRATPYRWVQRWPQLCAKAPRVLACGDLHVENFGTWRDGQARLVWGINDFDDAAPAPCTSDLVRLAASALIAADAEGLKVRGKDASAAILAGYADGIRAAKAAPFVLEEAHADLRSLALAASREPQKFWATLTAMKTAAPPREAKGLLLAHLPRDARAPIRYVHRVAGSGSLGLPRFVAIATLSGGFVAREVKARVPPAQIWQVARPMSWTSWYARILIGAGRDRDPFVAVEDRWLIRRLAPHCETIRLDDLAGAPVSQVLYAMGRETANIHRGDPKILAPVRAHLRRYGVKQFHDEARRMADDVRADWKVWRAHGK